MVSSNTGKRDSLRLVTACRAERTTVHGALGAALLLALDAQIRGTAPRRLGLNSLADLRGVLAGGLNERDLGLYVATLGTTHEVARETGFWDLAREVRARLQAIVDSGDANLIHSFYPQIALFPLDRRGAGMVQKVVTLAPPASMLTNIGRLEDVTLGNGARVESIAFLLAPPPQHPVCVTAATYAGCMYLNLAYDPDKLDTRRAGAIATGMMQHLERGA